MNIRQRNHLISCLDQTIRRNKEEQIHFLRQLIQTNSANPFTPDKSKPDIPIEREVARLIYKKLKEIGLAPSYRGVSAERPNVVVALRGKGKKTLILNGHMDTVVPSAEYTVDPFGGIVKGGKIYGVGALDMKASLSIFVFAAKALIDCQAEMGGDLIMTFVVDEEPGGCSAFGTKYLLDTGLTGDAAIVAEPGNRQIGIGHKGGYRFKLTIMGEAVHTGFISWERKERGHNAIVDMARAILLLEGMKLPYKERSAFPNRVPTLTFPTLIEGGNGINVVPDKCVAYGDCRLLPGVDAETVRRLIEEKLREIPKIKYNLEDLLFVPSVEISETEEIVQILKERTKEITGYEPRPIGVGPWNDGWMFITRGIPAVCGFGPNGKGVHAPDEFVYIESLIDTTRIYVRAIVDFLA